MTFGMYCWFLLACLASLVAQINASTYLKKPHIPIHRFGRNSIGQTIGIVIIIISSGITLGGLIPGWLLPSLATDIAMSINAATPAIVVTP